MAIDLESVLKEAVARKASDVLLTAGSAVAFRIHGDLAFVRMPPLSAREVKELVYGILTNDQVARFERDWELDFALTFQERFRYRGNVFYQRGAVAAALRVVPTEIPSFDELNLPPLVKELAAKKSGLLLVTGATGFGKSTTQAAILSHINSVRRCHVVTVEDPIEFLFTNRLSVIEQRELGMDTKSFAEALRHVLRQNPDVIFVGEMRDLDTIACALTAAETGHLVLSTLHTIDSVQAIHRLVDVFPPHQQGQIRSQLSMSLLAVLAQKLVPRVDKEGLILATEILINTGAAANLIRESKVHQLYTILETGSKDGMCTMDQSLKDLYVRGIVGYEDAKSRMRNPSQLG